MNYRTDLAVEMEELLEEARKAAKMREGETSGTANPQGYIRKQSQPDENISVISIEITDETGEKLFAKPKGHYVTVELKGILEEKDHIKQRAARAVAEELKKFIPFHYYLKVLVVGLGNEKVTPDSLGPHTVDKVKITRHLFSMFECDGDWEMANVSGFNPSVTGVTGMETAELIEKAVSLTKPEVVIVIDALAAKNIERISTTIQICDTGIEPGAGMGNRRRAINEESLGCKVVAIGVPTVIDARTLILDAAGRLKKEPGHDEKSGDKRFCEVPDERLDAYLKEENFDMIVTSTDIDQIIKDFADILADAINITLHPGIYS